MVSLYLSRSFRRKPLRHIAMGWIMLCAFMLPLVVSVYRDSRYYGHSLQLYGESRGQAFHITGATEADVELFRGIDGLTEPIYEDGTIYLTFESAEEWKNYGITDLVAWNAQPEEEKQRWLELQHKYSDALEQALAKSTHTQDLHLANYPYDYNDFDSDPLWVSTSRELLALNAALLAFSGWIVYSAYRNHIAGFSRELEQLGALGATRGQRLRLFFTELIILFTLAAAGAVGLTWVVMRFLYENFLGNTAESGTVWEVFHMDAGNTALEVLFYFLVCLGAMLVSALRSPAKGERKIRVSRRAISLPRLWMQRTRPPFAWCLLVIVPLMTISILLFNRYLGTYAQEVYGTRSAQILVTCSEGFSQEELDAVRSLSGIQSIQETKSGKRFLSAGTGQSYSVTVHSYQDCPTQLSALADNEFAAALPGGGTVGSTYNLLDTKTMESVSVTLAQLLPAEDDNPYSNVDIYVSDTLLQSLLENAPIIRLTILTSAQRAASMEAELNSLLPEANVTNQQNGTDTDMDRQVGRMLLLCWVFCVLMLAAVQIVWARLSGYVRGCGPMLRITSQVGGSRRQLRRLIPAWIGGLTAAVLPFAIAIPWAMWEAARYSRPFIVSGPVLGIYLAAAGVCLAAFWWPVAHSLRGELKQAE